MDPTLIKTLSSLYVYGPLGILSALGFLLYFMERKKTDEERKKSDELSEKLYEVSVNAIKADMEHSEAYKAIEKMFDILLKNIVERSSKDV